MTRRKRLAMTVGALVFATLLVPQPASAVGVTNLLAGTFTHATAPGTWVLPPAPTGTNSACLTAGTDTGATPLPGCGLGTPDADGAGALRLTSSAVSQIGMAFYSLSLPTKQGLDIEFDSYQYDGPSGNGITFALAAADPADPSPPASTGFLGGSMGYAANVGNSPPLAGLPYGYLGFGIDRYGDYTNSSYVGLGCATPPNLSNFTVYPQTVTVRTAGNGYEGYCIDRSSAENNAQLSGSLDDSAATTRAGARVPVEIALNPDSSPVTTGSGLNVPAGGYAIAVTPIGGTQDVVTGALPTTGNNSAMANQFPSSWIDPSTGLPAQLVLGWGATTGGAYEIHEVNALTSSTLNGQPPVFQVAGSNDGQDGLPDGGTVDYLLKPSLSSAEGSEPEDVTARATFPAGVTPGTAVGAGWSCTTNAQTVACTLSSGSTITAGATLPTIVVPATVAVGATGSKTVSMKVSSIDGLPASTEVTASVVHLPDAPSGASASVRGGNAAVSWSPPASDGGSPIRSYTVTATPAAGGTPIVKVVSAPATSTVLCCLPSDASYTFTIEATNGVGASPSSAGASVVTSSQGYRAAAGDGGVFDFGNDAFWGSATAIDLVQPIVGMAETPDGGGYWLVAADGGVFSYGNAAFHGNAVGISDAPIVALAPTPDGGGYWLAAADGGVFSYGDATFFGSAAGRATSPVVGIAAASDGGYWLASSDGNVFAFGDAASAGTAVGLPHGAVTAIASTPTAEGYWLVSAEGSVFSFGDAEFHGNANGVSSAPVVGITSSSDGTGYWLVAEDGGVFSYGHAAFLGSMAGQPLNAPMTGTA